MRIQSIRYGTRLAMVILALLIIGIYALVSDIKWRPVWEYRKAVFQNGVTLNDEGRIPGSIKVTVSHPELAYELVAISDGQLPTDKLKEIQVTCDANFCAFAPHHEAGSLAFDGRQYSTSLGRVIFLNHSGSVRIEGLPLTSAAIRRIQIRPVAWSADAEVYDLFVMVSVALRSLFIVSVAVLAFLAIWKPGDQKPLGATGVAREPHKP